MKHLISLIIFHSIIFLFTINSNANSALQYHRYKNSNTYKLIHDTPKKSKKNDATKKVAQQKQTVKKAPNSASYFQNNSEVISKE